MRAFTIIGATFGMSAVVLGAFGAHALEPRLESPETQKVWETAVDYQMWHALLLLLLSASNWRSRVIAYASTLFCAGVALFSGSLYWLALDGPRWLGPITPLGGLSLIIGWGLLVVSAIRPPVASNA